MPDHYAPDLAEARKRAIEDALADLQLDDDLLVKILERIGPVMKMAERGAAADARADERSAIMAAGAAALACCSAA